MLDNLSGGNSIVSTPKDIFLSSDIPIDMSVSDRFKTKIWAHEYVDFGLLFNSKKEQASFHLCLSKDVTQPSPGQPLITLEPNQNILIQYKCGSQPIKFLWVSIHRNIL